VKQIVIVEDNTMIRSSIQLNLETEGFTVYPFADAESFLRTHPAFHFDLLILDILLPGESGISLLKKVRRSNRHIPVLMLTVKKEIDIKIEALEMGADDYLVKPFHMKELILRVKALIRRTRKKNDRGTEQKLIINGYTVDIPTRTSESKRGRITLSEREIHLLEYFCINPGRDLSREDILEEVWGMDVDPTPRTVDNFVLKFRKLYETDPQHPNHFLTIRNIGYIYVP
jgi:two-component system alkaline phosphatase synthesis response regulator PhoP